MKPLAIVPLTGYELKGEDGASFGRADSLAEIEVLKAQMERRREYLHLRDMLNEDFPGVVKYVNAGFKSDWLPDAIQKYINLRKQLK